MTIGWQSLPTNITPVARMLVRVVPSRLASSPPKSGVHVLFKLKAAIKRPKSVCEVPISRARRLLSGPRIYEALGQRERCTDRTNDKEHILMTSNAKATSTQKGQSSNEKRSSSEERCRLLLQQGCCSRRVHFICHTIVTGTDEFVLEPRVDAT